MHCPHCNSELDGVMTAVPATVYTRYRRQNNCPGLYTEEEGSDAPAGSGYIFCEDCGQDIDPATTENINKWLGEEVEK